MKIIITESQLRFLVEQGEKTRSISTPRYDNTMIIPRIGGDVTDCEKIASTFKGIDDEYKFLSQMQSLKNEIKRGANPQYKDFKSKYSEYFTKNGEFLIQDFLIQCTNEEKVDRKVKKNILKFVAKGKPISASQLKRGGNYSSGTKPGQASQYKNACTPTSTDPKCGPNR